MSMDKESRKPFSVGFKGKALKSLKKRNPAKFLKNKRKRKRKKRLNMGAYIKKKIKARIKLRIPINKIRKKMRSTLKKTLGWRSLKRGGLLTSPEIAVALVPKIDIVDMSIQFARVHSISPMTGMVTFLSEDNTFKSLPLEVFIEIAVPMTEDHTESLLKLIFAELGEIDLIPVSRQDVLECTAEMLDEEHKAHCLELASENVDRGLGVDKGIHSRVKTEPDEMNRLTRFYAPLGLPILQEPVVFGGVFPFSSLSEEEVESSIKRVASFYRQQQHPSKMDKKDNKGGKGTPQGDDDSSTTSSPGWVTPQTGQPYNQETPSHNPTEGITQPAVYNNPGSAKVIPSGYGFVNKESVHRVSERYFNEKNRPNS